MKSQCDIQQLSREEVSKVKVKLLSITCTDKRAPWGAIVGKEGVHTNRNALLLMPRMSQSHQYSFVARLVNLGINN